MRMRKTSPLATGVYAPHARIPSAYRLRLRHKARIIYSMLHLASDSPPPFCCCTPHISPTLAYSAQEADTGPYKHICAQVDKVFEGMLLSRCVGTFSPRAALLHAPYFGCRVRFPDHILACCTLLSMRRELTLLHPVLLVQVPQQLHHSSNSKQQQQQQQSAAPVAASSSQQQRQQQR